MVISDIEIMIEFACWTFGLMDMILIYFEGMRFCRNPGRLIRWDTVLCCGSAGALCLIVAAVFAVQRSIEAMG